MADIDRISAELPNPSPFISEYYSRFRLHLGRLYIFADYLHYHSNHGFAKVTIPISKILTFESRGLSRIAVHYKVGTRSVSKRFQFFRGECDWVLHLLRLVLDNFKDQKYSIDQLKHMCVKEHLHVGGDDKDDVDPEGKDDPRSSYYDPRMISSRPLLMPYNLANGMAFWSDCPDPFLRVNLKGVSIRLFWLMVLSDASSFIKRCVADLGGIGIRGSCWNHTVLQRHGRGLRAVVPGEASRDDGTYSTLSREFTFQKPLLFRGRVINVCVEESQYAHLKGNADSYTLVFSCETKHSGMANCDSFRTRTQWEITSSSRHKRCERVTSAIGKISKFTGDGDPMDGPSAPFSLDSSYEGTYEVFVVQSDEENTTDDDVDDGSGGGGDDDDAFCDTKENHSHDSLNVSFKCWTHWTSSLAGDEKELVENILFRENAQYIAHVHDQLKIMISLSSKDL